jgi:hypothetical protein
MQQHNCEICQINDCNWLIVTNMAVGVGRLFLLAPTDECIMLFQQEEARIRKRVRRDDSSLTSIPTLISATVTATSPNEDEKKIQQTGVAVKLEAAWEFPTPLALAMLRLNEIKTALFLLDHPPQRLLPDRPASNCVWTLSAGAQSRLQATFAMHRALSKTKKRKKTTVKWHWLCKSAEHVTPLQKDWDELSKELKLDEWSGGSGYGDHLSNDRVKKYVRPVAARTILGAYAGFVGTRAEFKQARQMDGNVEMETYAIDMSLSGNDATDDAFVCTGLPPVGNFMAYINDGVHGVEKKAAKTNVEFVTASIGGVFPLVFVVTTQAVAAGEQFWTDYEYGYWFHNEKSLRLRAEFDAHRNALRTSLDLLRGTGTLDPITLV